MHRKEYQTLVLRRIWAANVSVWGCLVTMCNILQPRLTRLPKIYLRSYLNVPFMNNSSCSFHTPPASHLIEKLWKQKDKQIKLSHKIITAKQQRLLVPKPQDGLALGMNATFVHDDARGCLCTCSTIITTATMKTNAACVQKLAFIFFWNGKINSINWKRVWPQSNMKTTIQLLFCLSSVFSFFGRFIST